jgi:hypothetical protein
MSVFENNLFNQSAIEIKEDVLHYNSFRSYFDFQKYILRNEIYVPFYNH